jgi:ketose-bisphosphate aldolase
MPLVKLDEILSLVQKSACAVGAFNVWDMISAKNVVDTAEEMQQPVIVSLWKHEVKLVGEKQLYQVCRSLGQDAAVPVTVFIDHEDEISGIRRAITYGATSVMIDASALSFEENIKKTKEAVKIARDADVAIEGELGVLGDEKGSDPDEKLYTSVSEAKIFVEETGVDALAVSIGNAHGFYRKEPKLDFERLQAIKNAVNIPLVLHGGTGIPDCDVRKAISMGVAKVNIGADGRRAFMAPMRQFLIENPDEVFPHAAYAPVVASHKKVVAEKIRLFSS